MGWREIEALLPHMFIIGAVLSLLSSYFINYLKHKQTIRGVLRLLEANPDIDTDILRSIATPPIMPFADLRRGVLLIAVSVACFVFAQSMMDPEYKHALRGIATFPGFIGVIYLFFHFLPQKQSNDQAN